MDISRTPEIYNPYIGLFFAALLHELVQGTVRFPSFARSTASYSYTLYIIHFPILLTAYGITQLVIYGSILATLSVAAITIADCWMLARTAAPVLESRGVLRPKLLASPSSV